MYSILFTLITNIESLLWLPQEMLHSTFLYLMVQLHQHLVFD